MINHEKFFGTPEKAAEFLDELMAGTGCCIPVEVLRQRHDCIGCQQYNGGQCRFNIFDWLQEEVND